MSTLTCPRCGRNEFAHVKIDHEIVDAVEESSPNLKTKKPGSHTWFEFTCKCGQQITVTWDRDS